MLLTLQPEGDIACVLNMHGRCVHGKLIDFSLLPPALCKLVRGRSAHHYHTSKLCDRKFVRRQKMLLELFVRSRTSL